MLAAFAILLVFQCLGEGLVFLFGWPVPGPVTGMLLLLAALVAVPRLQEVVEAGANELLRHLSLLFVPAGVGIVVAASSAGGQWLAIVASVLVSTVAALAVTALVLEHLTPASREGEAAKAPEQGGGHV